jgi:hypothetical protein
MMSKADVIDVHARYCDAVDGDEFVSLFTEDATWTCEPVLGPYEGRGMRELCGSL